MLRAVERSNLQALLRRYEAVDVDAPHACAISRMGSALRGRKRYELKAEFRGFVKLRSNVLAFPHRTFSTLGTRMAAVQTSRAHGSRVFEALGDCGPETSEIGTETSDSQGSVRARATRLRALGSSRAYLYIFAAYSGVRDSELRRLRWRDIDVEGPGRRSRLRRRAPRPERSSQFLCTPRCLQESARIDIASWRLASAAMVALSSFPVACSRDTARSRATSRRPVSRRLTRSSRSSRHNRCRKTRRQVRGPLQTPRQVAQHARAVSTAGHLTCARDRPTRASSCRVPRPSRQESPRKRQLLPCRQTGHSREPSSREG